MSRRTLIFVTDPTVDSQLVREAIAQSAGDPMTRVEVVIAAVVPAVRPINACEPAVAVQLGRLREIAGREISQLHARGSAQVAPCRTVARLIRAAGQADRIVLVGSASWAARRAASRVAPVVANVAAVRPAYRPRVPALVPRATPPAPGS
jgi:hypothetical protein